MKTLGERSQMPGVRAPNEVIVRSCKYDGNEHRRWTAQQTSKVGGLLELTGVFDEEIDHPLLGKIVRGTESVEFYWTDCWYSIFRFSEPTGELRNFYCNINTPPSFDGRVLTFIDLDIDILVLPDLSYTVLDREEFLENAQRYNYPEDVTRHVNAAIAEVINLIETRKFPFDQCVSIHGYKQNTEGRSRQT